VARHLKAAPRRRRLDSRSRVLKPTAAARGELRRESAQAATRTRGPSARAALIVGSGMQVPPSLSSRSRVVRHRHCVVGIRRRFFRRCALSIVSGSGSPGSPQRLASRIGDTNRNGRCAARRPAGGRSVDPAGRTWARLPPRGQQQNVKVSALERRNRTADKLRYRWWPGDHEMVRT